MNLGQYINRLLPENEMVIIPGFGALVSKYKHAVINRETGEITPPSKEVVFYRQIVNDDGLLVGYIADINLLPRHNALKIIEKERDSIIYRLDKGERVLLEEVGEFFLDESNEIRFESHFDANMFPDSCGLESVSLSEEDDYEYALATTDADAPDRHEGTSPEPDVRQGNEPVTDSAEEAKPRVVKWWYLLLLIPLAIAVFLMIGNNDQKLVDPVPRSAVHIPDEIHTADSTPVQVTDSVEMAEPVLIHHVDSARYYLVTGSFQDEENVSRYIEKFNLDGYEPFYIGKTGSFHLVGIGKYNTEREAYRARRDYIEMENDPEAWIYIKQ